MEHLVQLVVQVHLDLEVLLVLQDRLEHLEQMETLVV